MKRRARNRNRKLVWYQVEAGPAKGAALYLLNPLEGAWQEMVEGSFDGFLYQALAEKRRLQGACCWDIGAHVGFHSLGFASQGAEVLAFEPNPFNAERLRLHLERNPSLAKHIRHEAVAVSDRDGQMTFLQSPDLDGGSSGSHLADGLPPLERQLYENFQQVTVPVVRMDQLLARGERPPDVVKIDIEGGEYLALQGGLKLLAEKKPLLLMEVHHICLMLHIQRLLQELGYTTQILDETHAAPSRCFVMAWVA